MYMRQAIGQHGSPAYCCLDRVQSGKKLPGSWRSEVTQMRTIARPVSGYKSSELAREFSNYIKRYVNSEDAVTWQESKIY